jgi:HAD superfamily hydrolase (TIGR01549 family)
MNENNNSVYGGIETARINAILFDVDGTLSNTDDRMVDRIVRALNPISCLFKDCNPKRFSRRLVMAVETPGNFFYHLADRFGIDKYIAKYYKRIKPKKIDKKIKEGKFWIIPGVREMLEALYARYPLGVVSARDAASTKEFLDFFELTQYFQVIVTAQTCHYTKPFPDPILYASKALGVLPANCLMIGDTIVDIQSGKSAGTQTVGVLCGFGTAKELMRVGADMILPSTVIVAEILLKNKSGEEEKNRK